MQSGAELVSVQSGTQSVSAQLVGVELVGVELVGVEPVVHSWWVHSWWIFILFYSYSDWAGEPCRTSRYILFFPRKSLKE